MTRCLPFFLVLHLSLLPPMASGTDLKEQIQRGEKLLEADKSNTTIREKLARLYSRKNNYKRVIKLLNPYNEQINTKSKIRLARAYAAKDAFEDEIRILKSILAGDNTNVRARMGLARAYKKQQKQMQSNTDKKKEIKNKAIQQFRKVIEIKPKYKTAYNELLELFMKNENYYEARGLVTKMIDRFGIKPAYLNDLCKLYFKEGYLQQAVTTCRKAVQRDDDHASNYSYLAQSYHETEKTKKAKQIVVQAAQKFPQSEHVLWTAGHFFYKEENYPVAEKYFKKAVKVDKSSHRAQKGLARAALKRNHFKRAYQAYVEACSTDPTIRPEFLAASTKVRQKGHSEWSRKYESAARDCH